MFGKFRESLEAPKPGITQPEKKETPLTEREQLKTGLRETLRKISALKQKEAAARLQGNIKLAEVFKTEIAKNQKEREAIINKLQPPRTEFKPPIEMPKIDNQKELAGVEPSKLPYEYYQLRSRDLAAKIAVLEKQAADARRQFDLKTAEKLKVDLAKVIDEQRRVLREAAEFRELKRQGKIQ